MRRFTVDRGPGDMELGSSRPANEARSHAPLAVVALEPGSVPYPPPGALNQSAPFLNASCTAGSILPNDQLARAGES